MTTDMDTSNADEYYVTALQIFDYCRPEDSSTLRVDTLMDKFSPLVKTNKDEFRMLKSLLDPEQENPEISVTKLAKALHKYSETQKSKVDLDESFNLKCGHAPQDSDSGISTDGYQLLEELQSELREKSHTVSQLRSQLEFTDKQHEEALGALVAERDSLRAQLNMIREENSSLTHLRHDYDEACERLCAIDAELEAARRELDAARRRDKMRQDEVAALHAQKQTLQDLLCKSKEECHRVNEMYASRQSALLEENENIKSAHADLAASLQDHEEFLQQIIKEKVLLEMELKDLLNKSNQTGLRFDRSIDVSYTEDQMLSALDSLNADTRFSQENQLLDEDSFIKALKEDQGRVTNMSLFDEIRLSISGNISRQPHTPRQDRFQYLDKSFNIFGKLDESDIESNDARNSVHNTSAVALQTENSFDDLFGKQDGVIVPRITIDNVDNATVSTQTECAYEDKSLNTPIKDFKSIGTQSDELKCYKNDESQTEDITNNNVIDTCMDCYKCLECDKFKKHINNLESNLKHSQKLVEEADQDILLYENHLVVLQKLVKDGNERNSLLEAAVDSLQSKIVMLEATCAKQGEVFNSLNCEVCCVQCQTESDVASVSTQVELPCAECAKRTSIVPRRWYFWEGLKCLFQLFAVVCFICAIAVLYGVPRRSVGPRCRPVPWRWLHAQDLIDFLLRIDYVAEVPM